MWLKKAIHKLSNKKQPIKQILNKIKKPKPMLVMTLVINGVYQH